MKQPPQDELPFEATLEDCIEVSPETYAAFLALLDAPAKPNEKLYKLMSAPLPWEKQATSTTG